MSETSTSDGFEDLRVTARDGLRLYGRVYRDRSGRSDRRRPVLCLAGLTRNSRDFHDVASALSRHTAAPRTVYTLDIRGRGLSDPDRDWRNYAVPIEAHDVIDFMTAAGLTDAGIIGTSRGGLIAMVLAVLQPTRIGAVVLNDIGPVIEADGLLRIAGYVGRIPTPKTWAEAARAVRELTRRDFTNMTDAEAEAIARQLFNERDGRPVSGYDQKLAKCLSVLDGPIPQLWPQFMALSRVPVMAIRGGNSDLLSPKTVEDMARRHPRFEAITVAGEGHAPLLRDASTIEAIAQFFVRADFVAKAA